MKLLLTAGIVLLVCLAIGLWLMMHYPRINYRAMPKALLDATLPNKPNWVSSKVPLDDAHYILPLTIPSLDGVADMLLKQGLVNEVVRVDTHQLIAYRQTKRLHFTDWLVMDENGDITASATMGYADFGENRAWVEAIRQAVDAR